jgi:intersectin
VEEPAAEPEEYNGSAGEKYIACYPYQSAEAGDLVFEGGEEVLVVKKDGDWWTGVIGSRTGIFPANYVQLADNNASVTNGTITNVTNNLNSMDINGSAPDQTSNIMSAEEARNQADADSEVSQINTQNVSNDANMQEFRGMTASAVS